MSQYFQVSADQLEELKATAQSFKTFKADFEAFQAWQKEHNANQNRPAALYGTGSNLTKGDKREVMQHVGQIVRAAIVKDHAAYQKATEKYAEWYTAKDAFSEASNGDGLYLVPSIWSAEIYSNVERYGYARRIAKVIPMPARDIKLNTGTGDIAVSWPGHNTAPNPFDANDHFSQVSLTAETMAAAAIIQKELDADAIASLYDYITMRFSKGVAKGEDTQFFVGSGAPFTGITGTGVITTNAVTLDVGEVSFADVSWTDMKALKLAVNPDIQTDGIYTVSSTVFGYLQTEADTAGRPIFDNERPIENKGNTGIDQAPWTYNGSPLWVLPNDLMPTSGASKIAAVFGDYANYAIFGVRQEMELETFDQAYGGVDLSGKRQIALQITERVALAFPDETAFAKLSTAAS